MSFLKKIFPALPKRYKYIAFSISFLVLAVLVAYFYVSASFLIVEDLVIRIDPAYREVNLPFGGSLNSSIDFSVNNHLLCSSTCNLALTRLSDDSLVLYEEFDVGSSLSREILLEYGTSLSGEGQELYNFKVSCQNQPSNICRSGGQTRVRNSVVAVNNFLSQDQENILENSKEDLTIARNVLEDIASDVSFLSEFYDDSFESRFLELVSAHREFVFLVNSYEFLDLENFLQEVREFESEVLLKKEEIKEFFEEYNTQVELLDEYYFSIRNASQVFGLNISFFNSALNKTNNLELFNRTSFEEDLRSFINEFYFEFQEDTFFDSFFISKLSCENCNFEVPLRGDFSFDSKLSSNLCSESSNNSVNSFIYRASILKNINSSSDRFENLINETRLFLEQENISFDNISSSYHENRNVNLNEAISGLIEDNLRVCNEDDLINRNYSLINVSEFEEISFSFDELRDRERICCYKGNCRTCCENDNCGRNPVLLVHGHSFFDRNSPDYSADVFNAFVERLAKDDLFIPGGLLTPAFLSANTNRGMLGLNEVPVVFKSTYYYITHFDEIGYIASVSKSENLDTYTIRLREIIDYVKFVTGSAEVDIVAHSMGGLIVRRYEQVFGSNDLGKVILVGTPNNGIPDRIFNLCTFFGANRECEDMRENSIFMRRLNDPRFESNLNITNIIGRGCMMPEGDGDGVVLANSVFLEQANNVFFDGECVDGRFLHSALLSPTKNKEVYNLIKNKLN